MHTHSRLQRIVASALAVAFFVGARAWAAGPHHGFLGGPWEVLAKMGHEGQAIRLPLSVKDENKAQEMNASLPVMATPISVRIKQYVPDLAWSTTAVADPNGGPVAKLSLRGERLAQDLWLSTRDRERQSISAHIGGVALRELPAGAAAALERLAEPDMVGILLVWPSETQPPLVYPVGPGTSFTLPQSKGQVSVLRYVPHYSIDRQTKEITNLSDKPVNPALQVRVRQDGQDHEPWLWSQFPMSPHNRQSLLFRARFLDFDLGGTAGQYLLAVTADGEAYLLHAQDGRKRLTRVKPGEQYPFNTKGYSFAVAEIRAGARIDTGWTNTSDMLLHPAVVADLVEGGRVQEVVLELGKPYHHKTPLGTLVVLYRRVP